MALYTDTKTVAVEALTSNNMGLVEALSTRTTFESVALACEEKGLITKASRQKLFDNNNSTPQTRAVELIDDVTNSVRFQSSCLRDFLCILTDKGGIPGRKVADLINDTYIDIEKKMSTKIMTIGQHDNTPSPPRKRLSDDGHIIDNAKKFCFDKEANNNCDDPVCCLLKKKENEKILSQIPIDLVHLLYTESLIDRETVKSYEENKEDKVQALLDDIHDRHHKFQLLASVLLRQESTIGIANEILGERHGEVWCEDPTNGRLQLRDCEEVCSPLVKDFMQLINDIISDMVDRNISPKDLLAFLQKIYIEPKLQIHSIKEIVKYLVTQKCSLLNLSLLETIVHHFGIKRVESLISQYKRKFEDISIDHPLSEFRPFCTSLLMCDCITIKLDKLFCNTSLASLNQLLSKVFDYFSKDVIVNSIFVKEEYVSVICYAPQYIGLTLQFELNTVKKSSVPDTVREILIGHFIAYKIERSEATMQSSQDFSFQPSPNLTQHSAYLEESTGYSHNTMAIMNQQPSAQTMSLKQQSSSVDVMDQQPSALMMSLKQQSSSVDVMDLQPSAQTMSLKQQSSSVDVMDQQPSAQTMSLKQQSSSVDVMDQQPSAQTMSLKQQSSSVDVMDQQPSALMMSLKQQSSSVDVMDLQPSAQTMSLKQQSSSVDVMDQQPSALMMSLKQQSSSVDVMDLQPSAQTMSLKQQSSSVDVMDQQPSAQTMSLKQQSSSVDVMDLQPSEPLNDDITMEELCKGRKGFVCDPEYLVDLKNATNDILSKSIETCNKMLSQIQREKSIEHFCFGVASVSVEKGKKFDQTDPATWNKRNIREKLDALDSYDGLAVFTIISELPSSKRETLANKQDYAISLLEELYQRCETERFGPKLEFKKKGSLSRAYVLFIAVMFTSHDNKSIENLQIFLTSPALMDSSSGCKFEEILDGKAGYVCDKDCLVQIGKQKISNAKETIANHLISIKNKIEKAADQELDFSIGIAHIEPLSQNAKVDSKIPATWRKDDICKKYKNGGVDCLIALTVITVDNIPKRCLQHVDQKEKVCEYTLALYQMLLHQFLLHNPDQCIDNKTFFSTKEKKSYDAYSIYVCFKSV